MNRLLENRTIVIVGGTSGLGISAAKACVAQCANVVIIGRSEEKTVVAADQLGERCRHVVGDSTDNQTVKKAIEIGVSEFGNFTDLYHVAGCSGRRMGDGPLHEATDQGWDFTIEQNLKSVFLSNRAATQKFMELGSGGNVLNMGSVLASSPSPKYFATIAYATSKAAIVGMTRSSAAYYAQQNIRFNVVAPALVQTPMAQRAAENDEILRFIKTKQPLDGGRIGAPSDLDGLVVYLLSDKAKFITGQVFTVDGGWNVSEGQISS